MRTLDLNADLGELPGSEGARIDAELMSIVTSANVACGGHAGDRDSMRRVCDLAVGAGVAIGAQVSYVDRAGFGRRRLDVGHDLLTEQLAEQIAELDDIARARGATVDYVKPHGALYHAAVVDPEVADSVILCAQQRNLPVLTLPQGELRQRAVSRQMSAFAEAFADRAYDSGGMLLPRHMPDSVIDEPSRVVARVLHWTRHGTILSDAGVDIDVRADSLCLHGDTPGAVDLARRTRDALESAGVALSRFTRLP